MGVPPVGKDGGTPIEKDGSTPHQEGWGTPPLLAGWGTPLSAGWGYPPAGVNRLKIVPSPILRMRTVKIQVDLNIKVWFAKQFEAENSLQGIQEFRTILKVGK